jgi:hypothetical protein
MGFIIRNIGGARKGIEEMGAVGNQGKYTMVIGEDEEGNPWEPLHVQQGLQREDSALSVVMINCSMLLSVYGPTAKELLDTVVYNVIPGRQGLSCLLINRGRACGMAEEGWTKEQIAKYISENAQVPACHFGSVTSGERRAHAYKIGGMGEAIPEDPNQMTRILKDPKWMRVVVAGGPGDRLGMFVGIWLPGQDWVTKKIQLPANWNKLVAKYKKVVPSYIHY